MKFSRILTALAILALAPCSFAGKVAVLNIEQAVLATDDAKKAEKAMQGQKEYSALIAKAESLKADYETLAKEEKTQSETWTAEKKQESQKKIKKLNEDYQEVGKKIQTQQQAVFMQIMQEMQPKLKAAVDEVVAAEKIDVILKSQAVFFAGPTVDITSKITEKLNKGKAAAAAPAAAAVPALTPAN